ncbi:MAG TPA: BON domain-containing protein [Gemmatimonadaceae bacterium]|nr:BON domain-containing protein [Gemmatimonadaceae bacterium]
MARDFEDLYDLDDMSDDDLQSLIREELADYDTLDADNILVRVSGGEVVLSGRVGTEEERRIADHVLTDVVGVTRYRNELLVDPIRRDEEPEAADDHLGDVLARGEDQLGGTDRIQEDPEAEGVHPDRERELYGTHDLESAIAEGEAWEAPDTPTPEGRPSPGSESPWGEEESEAE